MVKKEGLKQVKKNQLFTVAFFFRFSIPILFISSQSGLYFLCIFFGNITPSIAELIFACNMISAAFDINEKTVGTTIAGTPVYHEDQLEGFVRSHHVDVGLLAVPRPVAQSVVDKLVNAGVKGIWNFTNQELFLPGHEDVIVESVHFSESLLALSYMISQEEDEEKGAQE